MLNVDQKKMFTIGEAAKLCGVSRKTLRFYEKLGLLIPDEINEENGYRYYNEDSLQLIPVIKYYKQMGFKLQEMEGIEGDEEYYYYENSFRSKLDELECEKQEIEKKYTSVSDWLDLIKEADRALAGNLDNVNVKYIEATTYYSLEQDYNYDCKKTVINIPWVRHLEANNAEITGPVVLYFSDSKKRLQGKSCKVTIMQKPVGNDDNDIVKFSFGDQLFLSTYHLGNPERIQESYTKIKLWAEKHHFICKKDAFERYVVDYWTTKDETKIVTEVLIPIEKRMCN